MCQWGKATAKARALVCEILDITSSGSNFPFCEKQYYVSKQSSSTYGSKRRAIGAVSIRERPHPRRPALSRSWGLLVNRVSRFQPERLNFNALGRLWPS
jgi:hypothetical protein